MRGLNVVTTALAIGATAALGAVIIRGCGWLDGLGWLSLSLSFVITLTPLLVRRNDRLALWWLRLKYRLRGSPSLPWNLSVRLRGDFSDPAFFEQAHEAIRRVLTGRARLVGPRAINGLKVAVDGLGLVELVLDEIDELEATSLVITVTGLRVAPHEAEAVLTREILPLVREVGSVVSGEPLREQSWALRVQMEPKTNPFLGLYLRDREPGEVKLFRVSLLGNPASPGDTIDVDKTSIYLSASTSEGFAMLVRDFVTFSGRTVAAPAANA